MFPAVILLAIVTTYPAVRAEQYLSRLGGPRFAAREEAGRQLVKLGRDALPALRRGERHQDPEIAERCKRLIPLAEVEAVRQRVAILLDTPPKPVPADVPLARRFLTVTGDTREARERYVEMYVAHSGLLDEVARGGPDGATAFWRWVDKQLPERDPPGALDPPPKSHPRPIISGNDVALFWFLSADPGVRAGRSPAPSAAGNAFFEGPAVLDPPTGLRSSPAMRRLLCAWLVGPRSFDDPFEEATCLKAGFRLAVDLRLPEAREAALRVALDRDQCTCGRSSALVALAHLGRPDDVGRLSRLVEDDTVVGAGSVGGTPGVTVRIGDIALGVCVTLGRGRPADFGFPNAALAAKHPADAFVYGFPADGKARAMARQMWADRAGSPTSLTGGKR